MKVALIPEGGVLLTNLIFKNGHTPLQMYNMSPEKAKEKDPYDDEVIDYDSPLYHLNGTLVQEGNKYVGNEVPSGIKGRLTLADHIIQEAEAVIILGRAPKNRTKMYDKLNSAILLYGGIGTGNFPKFLAYLLRKKNIPRLEMAYPTNREELIKIFERTNEFLKNLENYPKDYVSNEDNITTDGVPYKQRISPEVFEEIAGEINKRKM
jgi:putative methanogenesis marker protein 5